MTPPREVCLHQCLPCPEDGAPKRGGPERCPRPCSECPEGEHHFSDAMIEMADDGRGVEEDATDDADKAREQATAAGCAAWYVCKHCDAWQEYTDDEDDDWRDGVEPGGAA